MTATIAAEMGEVAQGSVHYHVLFAIGIVLFVITFAINSLATAWWAAWAAAAGRGAAMPRQQTQKMAMADHGPAFLVICPSSWSLASWSTTGLAR
jgi:hypothetical protein